jgi:Flp pilus assembly protein TadD
MDIPDYLFNVLLVLRYNGFIPVLEQVTSSLVFLTVKPRIAAVQPPHHLGKRGIRYPYQKMIMIGEEGPSIKAMSAKVQSFLKQFDKLVTVFIILKQVSAINAAGHNMMKCSGNYDPCFARHALIYYYTPVPDYGILLSDMGCTDEAVAHYRKALELNPKYASAHNNLGHLLTNIGRTDEAMVHLSKALELNPKNAEAHNNFGILLAMIGRPDEAMVHFQKALELNPNYANAHSNLGNLLATIGRSDEAIARYQKALELNPNNGQAHYNISILLAKMGRTDEAYFHYRKALELNPNLARSPQ